MIHREIHDILDDKDKKRTTIGKVLLLVQMMEEDSEEMWESGYEHGYEDGKLRAELDAQKPRKIPITHKQ